MDTKAAAARVLLFVISLFVALFACEVGLRLAFAEYQWRNYAVAPARSVQMVGSVNFDAEIGYVPIPNRMDIGFGPIGNRINYKTSPNDPVPPLPDRPIIAFGDSFTYGSEVEADESWPALLERAIGAPVVNAGVGGYGIDQMVLLAERIVPKVKPRLVLLSFIPNDVDRVRASVFSGVAKPYFTEDQGELRLRNVPLQSPHRTVKAEGWSRAIFGYSFLVSFTMERIGLASWWRNEQPLFRMEQVDAVKVSCLLMVRMKRLSDGMSVPVVVIGQNGWSDFTPNGRSAREQQISVLDCARQAGIAVIDTFDDVNDRLKDGGREAYYVNGVGHMTAKGNAVVADVIANRLRAQFLGQLDR